MFYTITNNFVRQPFQQISNEVQNFLQHKNFRTTKVMMKPLTGTTMIMLNDNETILPEIF